MADRANVSDAREGGAIVTELFRRRRCNEKYPGAEHNITGPPEGCVP